MKTENKREWCEAARTDEEHFVHLYGPNLGVEINPDKGENMFAPDLLWNNKLLAELKIRNTPFFLAFELFGIPAQYAVTINLKDIKHYGEHYPGLLIYFWVEWTQLEMGKSRVKPMSGVWGINLNDLIPLCIPARIHAYKKRVDDNQGNAKSSYVVDLRAMKVLI